MSREAGKGSLQRPTNHERFSTSWDRIFGTQDANTVEVVMPEQSMKTVAVTVSPAEAITEAQEIKTLNK